MGRPIEKVQVWIHTRGRQGDAHLLMLKTTPERGGHWQPVTGKVEKGERLPEAATREAEEETGLGFLAAPVPLGFEFEFVGRFGPARETAFALAVDASGGDAPAIRIDPKEHVEWKWASPGDALALLPHETQRKPLAILIDLLKRGR